MNRFKIGALDVVATGGKDGGGRGDGPVVVLLHGFGASGEDLVGLGRVMDVPQGTRFLFPAALLSLAAEGYPAGRAWWRIDMDALQRGDRRLTTTVPAGLVEARASVDAVLDFVERDWRVPPSRVVLGGFSQGAMLSVDVALRRSEPLAGLAVLSGSVVAEGEWRPLVEQPRSAPLPPVFQSHGRSDPLLPFATAEVLRDLLRVGGAEVTFVPFRGGHEIPPQVLEGFGAFLTKHLR
jgi:phospholipase/carboxylesterase